jgi:hypothetical protein
MWEKKHNMGKEGKWQRLRELNRLKAGWLHGCTYAGAQQPKLSRANASFQDTVAILKFLIVFINI